MQALIILREESFSHSPIVMKDIFMSLGCLGQWIPEAYYWSQPTNFHSVLEGCCKLLEFLLEDEGRATPLMLDSFVMDPVGLLQEDLCGQQLFLVLHVTKFKASLRLTLANISIITSTLSPTDFLVLSIYLAFVIKYFVGFILKAIFCPFLSSSCARKSLSRKFKPFSMLLFQLLHLP